MSYKVCIKVTPFVRSLDCLCLREAYIESTICFSTQGLGLLISSGLVGNLLSVGLSLERVGTHLKVGQLARSQKETHRKRMGHPANCLWGQIVLA